jgi:hypothetical protein
MNVKNISGGVASLLMLLSSMTALPAAAATSHNEEANAKSIRDRIAAVQSALMKNQDQLHFEQPGIKSKTLMAAWGDRWLKTSRGSVWRKVWVKR